MVLTGCGGAVGPGQTSTTGAGAAGGVSGAGGGVIEGGVVDLDGEAPSAVDASGTAYVDPGCAQTQKTIAPYECAPYPALGACGPGARCSPYVTYADKCQSEIIGTRCEPAGNGVQGDDCTTALCADGYECVSAGSGFACARLCVLQGDKDDCPPGLICGPLDVEGFFVCG